MEKTVGSRIMVLFIHSDSLITIVHGTFTITHASAGARRVVGVLILSNTFQLRNIAKQAKSHSCGAGRSPDKAAIPGSPHSREDKAPLWDLNGHMCTTSCAIKVP